MLENKTEAQAKEEILAMVAEYCDRFKAKPEYKEGDRIPYASRVFDNKADSKSLCFCLIIKK